MNAPTTTSLWRRLRETLDALGETVAGFFHVAGDEWPTGAAFATIMFVTAMLLTGIFQKLMYTLRKGDTK